MGTNHSSAVVTWHCLKVLRLQLISPSFFKKQVWQDWHHQSFIRCLLLWSLIQWKLKYNMENLGTTHSRYKYVEHRLFLNKKNLFGKLACDKNMLEIRWLVFEIPSHSIQGQPWTSCLNIWKTLVCTIFILLFIIHFRLLRVQKTGQL